MKKVTLYLTKDSEGLEARMYKCLVNHYSILAKNQNTWCELLKTKTHHRLVGLASRHLERYHKYVLKTITNLNNGVLPENYKYDCDMVGSMKMSDVREGKNQKWVLQITHKAKD